MNFLEQIVAEYYAFQGYFVRTNIKFGKRARGGYTGEIDVAAFDPKEKVIVHIETSMDADSWAERKKKFRKKFETASHYYNQVFDFEYEKVRKIAVVGFSKTYGERKRIESDIKTISISELMIEITAAVKKIHPLKTAIPEGYPLLRAIQFASCCGNQGIVH